MLPNQKKYILTDLFSETTIAQDRSRHAEYSARVPVVEHGKRIGVLLNKRRHQVGIARSAKSVSLRREFLP
jgi:hypothetical protein